MGRNYYDVLGVPKGTSDEAAIKKAYKKAALKFHPDRPGGDKVKFQEVSEAFEVLSDSKKKQLYDRYGEAGLGASGGATPDDDVGSGGGDSSGRPSANPFGGRGGGGGGGQTFSFSTGGGRGNSNFHGSDPFSVFESIFGTMDVDQAMGTGGPGGLGACAGVGAGAVFASFACHAYNRQRLRFEFVCVFFFGPLFSTRRPASPNNFLLFLPNLPAGRQALLVNMHAAVPNAVMQQCCLPTLLLARFGFGSMSSRLRKPLYTLGWCSSGLRVLGTGYYWVLGTYY